jgi:Sec-independent protein secretion pathway component TatC
VLLLPSGGLQLKAFGLFALFVFVEIITPVSDPIVAPLTVMLPLVLLYELSIWLGHGIERGFERFADRQLQ